MGIKFDKFGPVMGDNYPLYVVDERYVGGCYLCVHDQGELIEKYKHYSLFVDVAGESRGDAIWVNRSIMRVDVACNSKFNWKNRIMSRKSDG
jgi:hypothetical protein